MPADPAAVALRERVAGDLGAWPFARRRGVFGSPALTVPGTLFALFHAGEVIVKVSPGMREQLLREPGVYEWVPEGSGMRSFGEWIAVPAAGRSDTELRRIVADAYHRAVTSIASSMDPPPDL